RRKKQQEEEERRRREEEERMEQARQEREREEAIRREEEEKKKKKGKRKGLGGLSPEKKKLLKKLIMQKAAEDLRNEAKAKAVEKEKYINEKVPPLKTEGMVQADLQRLVKELHNRVANLEEEVYDWEIKIRKQDFEINELTLKVNDTKGKFIKPVLRKVNKTESKLTKLQTKESRDFRGTLKSTGQNKYALKEEDESKTPDWREALKHQTGEGEEEVPPAES
ncbi:troponin, partial [Enterococcus faecium]|uniref:troponin n=1 Tax=Enterococcus faecium TaxID=1352 RepID=UPI002FF1CA3F